MLDKIGVYLASENYTQMITELEQQRQEINQMLEHIKAPKEDMDKKEESNTVLHCAYSCQIQMSILLPDFQEMQNEQLVIGG